MFRAFLNNNLLNILIEASHMSSRLYLKNNKIKYRLHTCNEKLHCAYNLNKLVLNVIAFSAAKGAQDGNGNGNEKF